jgi:hypothetical protein
MAVDPVVSVGLPNLWHCPACNHALGPLPGVPAHPLEPFGADVTCPECAAVISAGTILMVGGRRVDAVGRVGTGRRVWLTLITAAPVLYFGSSVLSTLIRMSSGQWSGSVRDILGLVLFGVAVVMVVKAWRRWGAGEGDDARMAVAWELQWLVRPGSIEFIDHRLGRRVDPSGLADQVPSTCLQADLLRSAYAQAPQRTVKGRDGSIRSAVELVLEHWKPGRGGHRKGIGSNRICVDAGSAEDSLELERKAAAQADGDRLAERLFRHCTGERLGVHGDGVTLRGHPDPVRFWPRPLRPASWALGILLVVLTPTILVTAIVMAGAISNGVVFWLSLAAGLLLLVIALFGLQRLLSRGAWRRELTRCVWTVGRQGLHVEQESRARPRSSPEHRSWLVPADSVADVEVGTAVGRPRIILRGRDGGEQAAITPDTLPADGPEASRRCLLAALGLPAA